MSFLLLEISALLVRLQAFLDCCKVRRSAFQLLPVPADQPACTMLCHNTPLTSGLFMHWTCIVLLTTCQAQECPCQAQEHSYFCRGSCHLASSDQARSGPSCTVRVQQGTQLFPWHTSHNPHPSEQDHVMCQGLRQGLFGNDADTGIVVATGLLAYTVRRRTLDDVMKMMAPAESAAAAVSRVVNTMRGKKAGDPDDDDDDLLVSNTVISLKDPLSGTRIQTAARSAPYTSDLCFALHWQVVLCLVPISCCCCIKAWLLCLAETLNTFSSALYCRLYLLHAVGL